MIPISQKPASYTPTTARNTDLPRSSEELSKTGAVAQSLLPTLPRVKLPINRALFQPTPATTPSPAPSQSAAQTVQRRIYIKPTPPVRRHFPLQPSLPPPPAQTTAAELSTPYQPPYKRPIIKPTPSVTSGFVPSAPSLPLPRPSFPLPAPTAPVQAQPAPSTPPSQLPVSVSKILKTPIKDYTIPVDGHGNWTTKNAFTPGARACASKVYRIKLQKLAPKALDDKDDDDTVLEEFRYGGATDRTIAERGQEHCSNANHPRGTSPLAALLQSIPPEERGTKYKLSIGPLATSPSPQLLGPLEDEAIDLLKETYGTDHVLNQRKGGGGGASVKKISTLTSQEIQEKLTLLIPNINWKPLSRTTRIGHPFTTKDITREKTIYIFKRTFPDTGRVKQYVGLSGNSNRRLSSHFSYANNPTSSTLKDKELYTDINAFWDQFQLGIISVQSIVDEGATLHKIETVAIKMFDSLKKSNGEGGYNLNRGGGGGDTKK